MNRPSEGVEWDRGQSKGEDVEEIDRMEIAGQGMSLRRVVRSEAKLEVAPSQSEWQRLLDACPDPSRTVKWPGEFTGDILYVGKRER